MTPRAVAARGSFGATMEGDAVSFRVWAPEAERVSLWLETGAAAGEHAMARDENGVFAARVPNAAAGDLYRFRLDDGDLLPDPASRFQPLGVHGASEIIDPDAFAWPDRPWAGIDRERAVVYELHVGTFTPAGTFSAALKKLPELRDLGVTVIELMPVADFPGRRNWGYDGVCLFAPARVYGRPDDLRRLVAEAHRLGLAVHLDVVYNHFGPDGAYIRTFAPGYFTDRHPSPWGAGVNLDGEGSAVVCRFILENALHWIGEYHIDGLRLDATHALRDDSPKHLVAHLVEAVRQHAPRHVMVVAEDHRNLAEMIRDRRDGGWDLDGVWADDFHHIMRRILAGDTEGYYEDYRDSTGDLVVTLRQGWFYTGQRSEHLGERRGTQPGDIPLRKFFICLQNHDQIGNRAFGERLSHQIAAPAYRAASALLLLAPETPLLFMGQEWAAASPFLFFTDHHEELGEQIVAGRRREFEKFSAFRDPGMRERIPSPQAVETFEASRLDWSERGRAGHRGILALYTRLLALRSERLRSADRRREHVTALALDDDTVLLRYERVGGLCLVARLRGSGSVHVPGLPRGAITVLTTEDPEFATGGFVPEVDAARGQIRFPGPAAVVLDAQA